jgi:hypothetical protein
MDMHRDVVPWRLMPTSASRPIEPDRGKLVSIDRLRDCADSQLEQQGVVK